MEYFYSAYLYRDGQQVAFCDGVLEVTELVKSKDMDEIRKVILERNKGYDNLHIVALTYLPQKV